MRFILSSVLVLWSCASAAETVVPSRTIRANAIIQATDIVLADLQMPNGFARLVDVVGQEARVVLYAGRPILVDDVGPPSVVTRNQVVPIRFEGNGITITTEGRALERGAVGDRIRLMNLASRATLFGQIMPDGTITVRK